MFDLWMMVARWVLVVLVSAMSFDPFALFDGSFSVDSVTSVLESGLLQNPEGEEEITEVIDGPGLELPDDGVVPTPEGPGEIGGPASEAPTPSPSTTPTPTATEEATSQPTPTESLQQFSRWNDDVLRWLPEIMLASGQSGVPASLLAAEIKIHSGGYPALAGPGNRHGLAQVPLSGSGLSAQQLYDPQTNLKAAAARFAAFKSSTGTWNASILADLQGLCDANCIQARSTAIRAWRAYYSKVLVDPADFGYDSLPGDWQSPQFDVRVSNVLLPLTYPPGAAPPTATPSPSVTATASPPQMPTETATPTASAEATDTQTATSTVTSTETATATAPAQSSTETATPTQVSKSKKKGQGSD